jgi:hypothetical protein
MNNASQHWWKIDHDSTMYPGYSSDAKAEYQAELDNFFAEVVLGGGSYQDLFLSNVAFVNKDNAAIYGLDASKYTSDFTKVQLDATQRPGFMTRVGFLSSYAHGTETAPILRGAFTTVFMLGVDPGPPLPGATMIQAPAGNYMTNRDKTTALVNQMDACKTCHTGIINPSGFVLETYDAVGRWQTQDPLGGAINGTADVTFATGDVRTIHSPLELMQGIAGTDKSMAIYAQDWVSFAYGRDPNSNDQCVADQLHGSLSQNGYTLVNLLADLTQADSFRLRVRATP